MSNRRPCQFFLRGSCRFGNNCRDYHPRGALFEDNNVSNNSNVGIFNPFSKNQDSINKSNNFNNSKNNNNSNTNNVLQTLELIGIVINSGVWPFGKIGLLNQTPLFTSLDLNFEEYRWKFYQNHVNNWNNMHLETIEILKQSYKNFIEQGKIQGYLPTNHHLYDLDLTLFSKIGNLYLPNLGKDSYNNKNNNNFNNPFSKSENNSLPFISNPFSTNNTNSTTFTNIFNNNNQISASPPSFVNSFNNNIQSNNNINDISNDIKISDYPNIQNNINTIAIETTNQSNTNNSVRNYSFNNPDIDDDIYQQELLPWEYDAFKNSFFEKNKIPEKIPPKLLRI